MDQNLNRAALDLLLQTGEFFFEGLAAPPLFPRQPDTKNIISIMKPFGVTTEDIVYAVKRRRSISKTLASTGY